MNDREPQLPFECHLDRINHHGCDDAVKFSDYRCIAPGTVKSIDVRLYDGQNWDSAHAATDIGSQSTAAVESSTAVVKEGLSVATSLCEDLLFSSA